MATLAHPKYTLVAKEEAEGFAWSFEGPNQEPKLYPFKFPPIQPHEIRIQQSYFGLCYTDCHIVNQEWFPIPYPAVPGHEIIGRVVQKGDQVTKFRLGELVGAGFIRNSCGTCKSCITGSDQLCGADDHLVPLCSHFGGFATHVQLPAHWAFPIPNNIPEHIAPPLMCAGVTVFAPLKRYGGPNKEVAVIGIGGLGHLAIKYSAAMGMKTTAVSTTAAKEAEARSYGATDFICSKNKGDMGKNNQRFDLVLVCGNASSVEDFILQAGLVKKGGDMVLVGVPDVTKTELALPFFQLVVNQINIIGSLVGSKQDNYEMLEFSARHKIFPTCQQFEFPNFLDAYNTLWKGTPRYRCVVRVGDAGTTLKQA